MRSAKFWLALFFLMGCIGQPKPVTVTLKIAGGRQAAEALDHPRYILTVTGPGVSSNVAQGTTATCLQLGATSTLREKALFIANGLSVQVPAGPNRVIRLLGFDYPANSLVSQLEFALQNPPLRVHVLGEQTVDLFGDTSVTLTNSYAQGTSANLLEGCLVPSIQSIEPASGGVHGGQILKVTGANLLDSSKVLLDGVLCEDAKAVSSAELHCISPPSTVGTKPVVVQNVGPKLSADSVTYNYVADLDFASFSHVPVVTSLTNLTPLSLIQLGTELVGGYLNGTNALVFFKDAGHSYQEVSASAGSSALTHHLAVHEDQLYSGFGSGVTGVFRRDQSGAMATGDTFGSVGGGLPTHVNGELDVIGGEDKLTIALSVVGSGEIQILKRDGDDVWTRADGGTSVNFDPGKTSIDPHLAFYKGKLHLAWSETTGTVNEIHVARNSGDDIDNSAWERIDGTTANGLNLFPNSTGINPFLIEFNDKLYAFWEERNNPFTRSYIQSAVWLNGNTWQPLNGISHNILEFSKTPKAVVAGGRLYVTWSETDGSDERIHLSVFNGVDSASLWTPIDVGGTGLNIDLDANFKDGTFPNLFTLGGSLYLLFGETDGVSETIQSALATLP